jgi:hypothetical protein
LTFISHHKPGLNELGLTPLKLSVHLFIFFAFEMTEGVQGKEERSLEVEAF